MNDLISILYILAGLLSLYIAWIMIWESNKVITERNKLRKITGAYYDIDIDPALKELGMTREQALKGDKE